MSPEEIATLAGTNNYKGGHAGGGYYDTITLGKDGKFYLTYYSQKKEERQDPADLGDTLALTILKIRSKLIKWENSVKTLESVEYDAGAETIPTTVGDLTEKQAKDMKASKSLIIYGLYNDQVTKLTVAGGSLYSPEDKEDLRLYSYLQSFEGDDHSFMVETVIGSKEVPYLDKNTGETKTNYNMTFAKGVPNDKKALALVGTTLKQLVEELKDNDLRDLKFLGSSAPAKTTAVSTGSDAEDEEPF